MFVNSKKACFVIGNYWWNALYMVTTLTVPIIWLLQKGFQAKIHTTGLSLVLWTTFPGNGTIFSQRFSFYKFLTYIIKSNAHISFEMQKNHLYVKFGYQNTIKLQTTKQLHWKTFVFKNPKNAPKHISYS